MTMSNYMKGVVKLLDLELFVEQELIPAITA